MTLTATDIAPIVEVLTDNQTILFGIAGAVIGFSLLLKLVRRAAR